MTNLVLGKRYSFNTTVPAILGETMLNVKYLGEVSYEVAKLMDSIDIRHRQLYHHLTGVADDPSSFVYYIFEGADSKKVVLAQPWINVQSIMEVQATRLSIIVEDITLADVEVIRALLLSADYNNFRVTVS